MSELVKTLAGTDGVNLALLLALLGLSVAVIFLWRQMNKERETERTDRLKVAEQQAKAMDKLETIVANLGHIATDLKVMVASCGILQNRRKD
jgi:membrane protein implicated in regulation of membrane protease activity